MSKRKTETKKLAPDDNERLFREVLSKTISGTSIGLWFLIPEYHRLGAWDLVKGFTGGSDRDIDPHIAMQIVNEAALCNNRIRRSNYLAHQGFELTNGLGFLSTDQQVHYLLDEHTIDQAKDMQNTLAAIRANAGHYHGNTIAVDPHRVISTTRRIMPAKKKQPREPSKKMLQTFFAVDTNTGQPIGLGIGSPGVNTTKATIELLEMVKNVNKDALVLADKEHFTDKLIKTVDQQMNFDLLVPVITNQRIKNIQQKYEYKPLWAGYAIAETSYRFAKGEADYRLITQREGEVEKDFTYKSFITLSNKPADELLSVKYMERWSIEDFFNFDGDMGFNRASTFNLNIRYGKMSLALLAQSASYQFRQLLPAPYKRWNATHLADAVLARIDGDIRVKDDTIIVTCYNAPKELELKKNYINLPQRLVSEGINPHIPWLYNYKLDFRFK